MKELSNEDILLIEFAIATQEELEYLYNYILELDRAAREKKKLSQSEIEEMFGLYNRYFRRTEKGYYCDTCRKTVYRYLSKSLPYLKNELYERTSNCIYRNQ